MTVSGGPGSSFTMLVMAFLLAIVFSLAITVRMNLLLTVMLFLGHAGRTIAVHSFRGRVSPGSGSSVRVRSTRGLTVPRKASMCRVSNPCFFNVTGGFRRVAHHSNCGGRGPIMQVVHVHGITFVSDANVRGLRVLYKRSHESNVRVMLSNMGRGMRTSLTGTNLVGALNRRGIYDRVGVTLHETTRVMGGWRLWVLRVNTEDITFYAFSICGQVSGLSSVRFLGCSLSSFTTVLDRFVRPGLVLPLFSTLCDLCFEWFSLSSFNLEGDALPLCNEIFGLLRHSTEEWRGSYKLGYPSPLGQCRVLQVGELSSFP